MGMVNRPAPGENDAKWLAIGLCMIIALFGFVACPRTKDTTPVPTPSVTAMQTGRQAPQVPHGGQDARCTTPGPIEADCLPQLTSQGVMACEEEDGRPDGKPCVWADSLTGQLHYVTSEQYR